MNELIIMTSSFCQPRLDQKPTIAIRPSIPFDFLSNDWYQNTILSLKLVLCPSSSFQLFFLAF
jgi:hypothetical protein